MKTRFVPGILVAVFYVLASDGMLSAQENAGSQASLDGDAIEVVVSATRSETPRNEVASAVTVIDAKEIEQKQENSIAEALRSVPSADVVQSGGKGGNTAVFLRGANPEHTLVLIDGIEVNNPITTSRVYNFADLVPTNIERIEVLRGPQSTLYGSDAMGGVVSVITKKGVGEAAVNASSEAGSYGTFIQKAGLSGANDLVNYSAGFYQENSAGISAADASFGNTEHDGYANTSLSTRLGLTASEHLEAQTFLRYIDARADLDNWGGFGGDDPNRKSKDEQLFTRGELLSKFLDGTLKQKIGVSFTDQTFTDRNYPDLTHPIDVMDSQYTGRTHKIDFQNTYAATEYLSLIAGAETAVESGNSYFSSDDLYGHYENDFTDRSATTNSYYAEGQSAFDNQFFASAGLRYDDHSRSGSQVTWRVAPAYLLSFTDTKFSTTLGTGFKAPSLYQLYSSYGDENLKSEKSLGLDAGVEQYFLDKKMSLSTFFFYNKFKDLIQFEPNTFLFENIADAKTEGLEVAAKYKFDDKFTVRTAYTLTDTKDIDSGQSLLRRARNKASIDVGYNPIEKVQVGASVLFTGKRFDNDYATYPVERVALASYAVVNLTASYQLCDWMQVYARIDNLFDRNYEEIYGYGSLGSAAYGGIKIDL